MIFTRLFKKKKNFKKIEKQRRNQLNKVEIDFIKYVQKTFKKHYPKANFEYNVLSDKTINFRVDKMQVGRVKLRGKKMGMQILTKVDCKWLDIKSLDLVPKAKKKVSLWLRYYKSIK